MRAEGAGLYHCNTTLNCLLVLETREVPEDWKRVNVTPNSKKDKKKDPGNKRLVSLTSVSGKVTEKILLEINSKQMKDNKVMRSSLRGFFLRGTNLITFYNEVPSLVDEGGISGCCLPGFQ